MQCIACGFFFEKSLFNDNHAEPLTQSSRKKVIRRLALFMPEAMDDLFFVRLRLAVYD